MFINNSIITYPIAFTLYNFDFKCVFVYRMFDDQRKTNEKVWNKSTKQDVLFHQFYKNWFILTISNTKWHEISSSGEKKTKHIKRKITCNTRLICFKWCSVKEYPNSQWCKDCYGLRTTLFDVFAWSYLWLVVCVRTTVKSIN